MCRRTPFAPARSPGIPRRRSSRHTVVEHHSAGYANLDLTYGALFSQRVLLALVTSGMTRDDAYRVAQQLTQKAWDERIHLRELLEARPDLGLDLDTIFDLDHYARYAEQIVTRLP